MKEESGAERKQDKGWERGFLNRLDSELETFKTESVFLEGEEEDDPYTMRVLFDIGVETKDVVVMDVMPFQLDNGLFLVQLYTVVVVDVEDAAVPALMPQINELNLPVPVGAFGYFAEQHQVYHKHSVVAEEKTDIDTLARRVSTDILLILDVMDIYCEKLTRAAGQM